MTSDRDQEHRLQHARAQWRYRGGQRPSFAALPGPGQESVWDYPRPPRWAAETRLLRVECGGVAIAQTRAAIRVLETGSAPTFYFPPADVRVDLLMPEPGAESLCEWKGRARYFAVRCAAGSVPHAAWCYPQPFESFAVLAGFFAFYPTLLECYVDSERVRAQAGGFYGGWVTDDLAGPFKGEPGTEHW